MKKAFLISILIALLFNFIFVCANTVRNKSKVVFCDVGQGDATYIRLPEQIDILIDTGPAKKVLNCLSNFMPYYDREIEMLFLTHPQKDHVGAVNWILKSYTVKNIFVPDTLLNQKLHEHKPWHELKKTIESHRVNIHYINNTQRVKFKKSSIKILWPQKRLGISNVKNDINNIALAMVVKVNKHAILLPADIDAYILERLLQKSREKIDILKIGHHGSKTSTTKELLRLADPAVSVISVGKLNSYGHPHKDVLLSIQSLKLAIKRTDEDGNVFFSLEKNGFNPPKFSSSLEK